MGSALRDLYRKGGEFFGFDNEKKMGISAEAVRLANELAPYIVDPELRQRGDNQQIEIVYKDTADGGKQSHIMSSGHGGYANESLYNAINHALFSYEAGQSPLAGMGAQVKEFIQAKMDRDDLNAYMKKHGVGRDDANEQLNFRRDPANQQLDYFNNKFGIRMASQGLTPEEARNEIVENILNNQGTNSRSYRGVDPRARYDLILKTSELPEPNYFFRK